MGKKTEFFCAKNPDSCKKERIKLSLTCFTEVFRLGKSDISKKFKKSAGCVRALFLLVIFLLPSGASAGDGHEAKRFCAELKELLNPERVVVTVKGDYAWTEVTGAVIDGMRVDKMKLRAKLKKESKPGANDKFMKRIQWSQGEVSLKEEDVNGYLSNGVKYGGFSALKVNFKSGKSAARGIYSANLLVKIRMEILALANITLENNAIYLREPEVYVQGIKQSGSAVEKMAKNVTPLFSVSSIPFPVKFTKLITEEGKAKLTSNPNPVRGGETRSYTKKNI